MVEKNPFVESNIKAMEFIWRKLPKEVKDQKEYVTYIESDIPYLYYSGLVDTQRHSLEKWKEAFEECKSEDERYWVSHEKMLSLSKFRYCIVVNEPFDPLKMRTGKYTADRLWQVYEKSMIPSCALPREFFEKTFDVIIRQKKSLSTIITQKVFDTSDKLGDQEKKNASQELKTWDQKYKNLHDGEYIVITREHLENLRKTLDMYPSPRRKMELAVQNLRTEKLQQLADVATKPQESSYEEGADFRETTKKSLKDTLVKASEDVLAGRKPKGEIFNIKDVQKKSPKKIQG